MTLSKSDYMLFLRHPAWLWLKKHQPEKLPGISAGLQARFDTGNLFEALAEQLFSGALRLGFDSGEYRTLATRTMKAIKDGKPVILQGRFLHEQLTFIADVIINHGGGEIDLIEIKSSTDVKKDHEYDLAFQAYVAEKSGFTIRNIFVIHVNNEYVRNGEIDVRQITVTADVTNAVRTRKEETEINIEAMIKAVSSDTIPDISPSRVGLDALHDWINIYRTLTDVPPHSIYDLCWLNAELVGDLEREDIRTIVDIPKDITLNSHQTRQVQAVRENRVIINRDDIRVFLKSLRYPLYFLDYETFAGALPAFDGLRPYQNVPFQYSLHILDKPGGQLRAEGYLHKEKSNPVEPLSQSLMSHIGPKGTVLAWHASFETGKNEDMGDMMPEFRKFYSDVNGRVIDLEEPFAEGQYVHKDFLGHSSIKNVLPVLIPELSYKDLNIQEGMAAQRIWMETVLEGKHEKEREQIFKDLEKYCNLDTLAMVKIYEKLIAI